MRLPGYKILLRLMDRYADAVQEGASNIALSDPLSNANKIAHAFAYALMARAVRAGFENGVNFELDVLKLHQRDQHLSPEEIARRRRDQFALEAIPAR